MAVLTPFEAGFLESSPFSVMGVARLKQRRALGFKVLGLKGLIKGFRVWGLGLWGLGFWGLGFKGLRFIRV